MSDTFIGYWLLTDGISIFYQYRLHYLHDLILITQNSICYMNTRKIGTDSLNLIANIDIDT